MIELTCTPSFILQSGASGSNKRNLDEIVEYYTDSESDGEVEVEVIYFSIDLLVLFIAFSFCYEWMFNHVKMINLIFFM